MILVIVTTLLIAYGMTTVVVYRQNVGVMEREIRQEAQYIRAAIRDAGEGYLDEAASVQKETRLTLIGQDGQVLYDSDLDAMLSAITPSAEKLEKHGVASVRQRVANIRPMLGEKAAREGVADMSSLMSWFAGYLCDTVLPLPEQAMSRIGIISGRYLDRDFIENGRHSSRPSGQRPDSRI